MTLTKEDVELIREAERAVLYRTDRPIKLADKLTTLADKMEAELEEEEFVVCDRCGTRHNLALPCHPYHKPTPSEEKVVGNKWSVKRENFQTSDSWPIEELKPAQVNTDGDLEVCWPTPGGLVVIAKDLDRARKLASNYNYEFDNHLGKVTDVPDFSAEIDTTEEQVWVFPDAVCC